MKGRKGRRSPGTILLCSLFFTLTVGFFSPLEVVLLNAGDFYFPFANVWWFQLAVSAAAALILSLPMIALPPRAGRTAASVFLGAGLAAYLQAMFLNGGMVTLTGERMMITPEESALNLAVWGAVILTAVLAAALAGKKRQKAAEGIMRGVSLALIAMQAVAMAGQALINGTPEEKPDQYLSAEGEFELSRDTNVIEFVLDTADGTFVRRMLEMYPELGESLGGWVYYPNATSTHSRTYPSIPYMLTGEVCHMDLPVSEYVNQAYENSGFLRGLYGKGTDIRIYTWDPELVSAGAGEYIANSAGYRYGQFENLNLPRLEENLMRIALYKSLPYAFKNHFQYNIVRINQSSFRMSAEFNRDYSYMDPSFRDDLMIYDPMTVTDRYSRAFRFYHLFGTHPGADWNENLEGAEDAEYAIWDLDFRARALRGSFRMIEDYIGCMKEKGIYDRATIIVTADHGISDDEDMESSLDRKTVSCPVMMVKYAGCDQSLPLRVDESPVAHEDIFATVEEALGAPVSGAGSGRPLNGYRENEPRERYYYHSAFRSDGEGEIALREYRIDGDAEQLKNWHITGKWWPVRYSANEISDEKFEDLPEAKTAEP